MKKVSNLLVVPCVIGLFLGVSGVGNDMVSGFALAISGVTFVLAFITRIIGNAEAELGAAQTESNVTRGAESARSIGQSFQHQT